MIYFDDYVARADFFFIKLSQEFTNHMRALPSIRSDEGALDYNRSYADIHILIEVMDGVYAVYLKDYNFGHIKPFGDCVYEVASDASFSGDHTIVSNIIIPELQRLISTGEIDLEKELYEYYHILPDSFIPFMDVLIRDHITVSEAARMLNVTSARVKKMVADKVLDGFKRNGRVFLSRADVEKRKLLIDKHGKPTKGGFRESGEIT